MGFKMTIPQAFVITNGLFHLLLYLQSHQCGQCIFLDTGHPQAYVLYPLALFPLIMNLTAFSTRH